METLNHKIVLIMLRHFDGETEENHLSLFEFDSRKGNGNRHFVSSTAVRPFIFIKEMSDILYEA